MASKAFDALPAEAPTPRVWTLLGRFAVMGGPYDVQYAMSSGSMASLDLDSEAELRERVGPLLALLVRNGMDPTCRDYVHYAYGAVPELVVRIRMFHELNSDMEQLASPYSGQRRH